MTVGRVLEGKYGTATEIIYGDCDNPDHQAHIGTWLLYCPGQSPAWSHYMLASVSLRPVPGESRPATITVPGATHEFMLLALNPLPMPTPENAPWPHLTPANMVEQVELPSDEAAAELLAICALSVVKGALPAEPPMAGAKEPWRTALIKSAAHMRGEVHAP